MNIINEDKKALAILLLGVITNIFDILFGGIGIFGIIWGVYLAIKKKNLVRKEKIFLVIGICLCIYATTVRIIAISTGIYD